jgi:hypothetical protein
MRRLSLYFAALGAVALSTAMARAQSAPVIDGAADVLYGPALSTQNTQTQFGDNNRGDLVDTEAGGSEIDQVFGAVANDGAKKRLYLLVAGNLENNFNKLEIFIDVDGAAGGVNTIDGSALPAAVDAFCCGGFGTTDGALQRQSALTFDADFFADYYVTLSSGGESQGTGASPLETHWAVSAHYADLTEGTAGRVVAAGMQLAPKGLPSTLKAPLPADFDRDFDVDGGDFLTWQRGLGVGTNNAAGDSDRDGDVDGVDLVDANLGWTSRFGKAATLADLPYNPSGVEVTPGGTTITTQLLLDHSPTLPGLSQGELIDKNYAFGPGGATTDPTDGAAGAIAPELDFVLPQDTNDPANDRNHRNMENTIDMRLAFDNSNTAGVEGGGGQVVTGNPGDVRTGIELSIPLDQLLNSLNAIPSGDIRVLVYVNGTGHDFASNQWSGEGVLQGNFGSSPPDLELFVVGKQYVVISQAATPAGTSVPEPTSLVLTGLIVACGLFGHCGKGRSGVLTEPH